MPRSRELGKWLAKVLQSGLRILRDRSPLHLVYLEGTWLIQTNEFEILPRTIQAAVFKFRVISTVPDLQSVLLNAF